MNPLIVVRVHAPEQAFPDNASESGHTVGHNAGELSATTSGPAVRRDLAHALATAVTRALATGDADAARIALAALEGLVASTPERGPR